MSSPLFPSIITWASIGCGNVCEVKSLPAMYTLPGSRVAGVYARNLARAQDFARRHSIPKVYESVWQLVNDPEVDIVYIATPPDTHLEYTMAALDAGKHVYVEKPMALTYSDALRMHERAKVLNLGLFPAHYRRGLPYFHQVKKLLAEKTIGKLLSVKMELILPPKPQDSGPELPWRLNPSVSGGGYFYDLAPHGLDIVQFLLDQSLKVTHGHATNRAGLYPVEDTLVASFLTDEDIPGTAQWCFVANPASEQDSLLFTGTKGEIQCAVFSFAPIKIQVGETIQTLSYDNPAHIQAPIIQSILEELRGEGTCFCQSSDGLATAKAMDQIMGVLP